MLGQSLGHRTNLLYSCRNLAGSCVICCGLKQKVRGNTACLGGERKGKGRKGLKMFRYHRALSLTPVTRKGMLSVRRISEAKPLSEDAPLLPVPGPRLRASDHLDPVDSNKLSCYKHLQIDPQPFQAGIFRSDTCG